MSSHREVNREKQRKAIQNNEEFKLLQEQKTKRIEEEQHQRQMVKLLRTQNEEKSSIPLLVKVGACFQGNYDD